MVFAPEKAFNFVCVTNYTNTMLSERSLPNYSNGVCGDTYIVKLLLLEIVHHAFQVLLQVIRSGEKCTELVCLCK